MSFALFFNLQNKTKKSIHKILNKTKKSNKKAFYLLNN